MRSCRKSSYCARILSMISWVLPGEEHAGRRRPAPRTSSSAWGRTGPCHGGWLSRSPGSRGTRPRRLPGGWRKPGPDSQLEPAAGHHIQARCHLRHHRWRRQGQTRHIRAHPHTLGTGQHGRHQRPGVTKLRVIRAVLDAEGTQARCIGHLRDLRERGNPAGLGRRGKSELQRAPVASHSSRSLQFCEQSGTHRLAAGPARRSAPPPEVGSGQIAARQVDPSQGGAARGALRNVHRVNHNCCRRTDARWPPSRDSRWSAAYRRRDARSSLAVTTLSMADIVSAMADGWRRQLRASAPAGPGRMCRSGHVGLAGSVRVVGPVWRARGQRHVPRHAGAGGSEGAVAAPWPA